MPDAVPFSERVGFVRAYTIRCGTARAKQNCSISRVAARMGMSMHSLTHP